MPKVSLMMPAYNVEKYIGEAIESVLDQTFQDFELLIVEDGSTDQTYRIARQYEAKSDKIRLFQNDKNRGIAYSRNRLLEEAQGTYLAVLDSDDVALPTRLEKQVQFLDAHPEVGLLGTWIEHFGKGAIAGETSQYLTDYAPLACRLLFQNNFAQSSVMFRRALAKLGYDSRMPPAEDYHLWVRISWQTAVRNLPEPLVRYRVHDANISSHQADVIRRNVAEIYRQQLVRLGLTPTEDELKLHYALANQRLNQDENTLQAALNWLTKLHRANQQTQKYPAVAFNQEISYHLNYLLTHFYPLGSPLLSALEAPLVRELVSSPRRWQLRFLALGDSQTAPFWGKCLYALYKKVKT